jgi:hypothetical protein
MNEEHKTQKLILFSILLLILLSYPFISIINKTVLVGGFPVLFLYIFLVWIFAIIILQRLSEQKQKRKNE